jgi:LPS O-antigen subunit length determinant protein (WzzB/FepE family)
MKSLRDNRELYDYLLSLTSVLRQRGREVLSERVAFASAQASGLSTEFLGESRIALRQVWKEEDHVLTEEERAELSDVLRQLDEALDRR